MFGWHANVPAASWGAQSLQPAKLLHAGSNRQSTKAMEHAEGNCKLALLAVEFRKFATC